MLASARYSKVSSALGSVAAILMSSIDDHNPKTDSLDHLDSPFSGRDLMRISTAGPSSILASDSGPSAASRCAGLSAGCSEEGVVTSGTASRSVGTHVASI